MKWIAVLLMVALISANRPTDISGSDKWKSVRAEMGCDPEIVCTSTWRYGIGRGDVKVLEKEWFGLSPSEEGRDELIFNVPAKGAETLHQRAYYFNDTDELYHSMTIRFFDSEKSAKNVFERRRRNMRRSFGDPQDHGPGWTVWETTVFHVRLGLDGETLLIEEYTSAAYR